MTELAEPLSTTLDTSVGTGAAGAGAPRTLDDPAKPEAKEPASLRDTIASEVKGGAKDEAAPDGEAKPEESKAKDEKTEADGKAKPDDKPADVKADKADDGKAVKLDEPSDEADKPEPDTKADKPGHYEPPKALLPDAREKWVNVPRTVQRDIDNMARQHESEVTRLREATQRYDSIRQFDELAQQNGRDLKDSLAKMAEIEDKLQSNPVAGLNAILQEVGPRKADGSPVSLYEVATYIAQQGPEGYQRIVAQQPPQQQQENPEVLQLKQQIAQMQVQQVASSVIEPFKASHPRYDELRGTIAQFLKTDMIPTSLSASDRLEAAYNMAERLNPPSNVADQPDTARPDPDRRADTNLSGSKSIKSAPGSVTPDLEPDRGGSIRDLLADEMRRKRA